MRKSFERSGPWGRSSSNKCQQLTEVASGRSRLDLVLLRFRQKLHRCCEQSSITVIQLIEGSRAFSSAPAVPAPRTLGFESTPQKGPWNLTKDVNKIYSIGFPYLFKGRLFFF
jgi:hypothetical protein